MTPSTSPSQSSNTSDVNVIVDAGLDGQGDIFHPPNASVEWDVPWTTGGSDPVDTPDSTSAEQVAVAAAAAAAAAARYMTFHAVGSRGLIYTVVENSETIVVKLYFSVNSTCSIPAGSIEQRPTCWINAQSFIESLRPLALGAIAAGVGVPFPSEADFYNISHWPIDHTGTHYTQLQSLENVNAEARANVDAAGSPNTMAINVPIDRRVILLPLPPNLRCSCCDLSDNCGISTLHLVVERQLFFSDTAEALFKRAIAFRSTSQSSSFSGPPGFSTEDAFVLYVNWMSDQIAFWLHYDRMHVDGHLGNILVSNKTGTLLFVWNDFGRSTTNTEAATGSRTMTSLQNFAAAMIPDFVPDACRVLDAECAGKSLAAARSHPLYKSPSVIRRLVAKLLTERVSNLQKQVEELCKDNTAQSAQIADQWFQINEQAAQIANQSDQIAKQSAQIANQSVEIADLRAFIDEQSAQIANQSAQITNLRTDNAQLSALVKKQQDRFDKQQANSDALWAAQNDIIKRQETVIANQTLRIVDLEAENKKQAGQIATLELNVALLLPTPPAVKPIRRRRRRTSTPQA